MSKLAQTFCVLTRAQNSELPYIRSFVEHYVARLGFDKILIIYCDHRDPADFIATVRKWFPDTVEVFYSPDNVTNIDDVFENYIGKIKEYDYCLNVDLDEFLAIPEGTVPEWLKSLGNPRSVEIPWLNISHFGPPVDCFQAMIKQGQVVPSNNVKTISATGTVAALTCHRMQHTDQEGTDLFFRWEADGNPFPNTAHPLGQRASIKTLGVFTGNISQTFAGRKRKGQRREIRMPAEFACVMHFHIRGPVDLLLKTMYQNFIGSNRRRDDDLTFFLRTESQNIPFERVPARFKYAFASKSLVPISPDWEAQLRELAAKRAGSLPVDLDLQRSLFISGLASCGLERDEAEKIWITDRVPDLFNALEERFRAFFDPGDVLDQRHKVVEALIARYGAHLENDKLFSKAIGRAYEKATERELKGQERINFMIATASGFLLKHGAIKTSI